MYRVSKSGPIEHRPTYFVVTSTTAWPRSWSGLSPCELFEASWSDIFRHAPRHLKWLDTDSSPQCPVCELVEHGPDLCDRRDAESSKSVHDGPLQSTRRPAAPRGGHRERDRPTVRQLVDQSVDLLA